MTFNDLNDKDLAYRLNLIEAFLKQDYVQWVFKAADDVDIHVQHTKRGSWNVAQVWHKVDYRKAFVFQDREEAIGLLNSWLEEAAE